MLVVALTGTIGAGKSTVGRALAERGAFVVDTDELARKVLAPGSHGEQAVLAKWGRAVKGPDGRLDRKALAGLVFADPVQLAELEAISHPLVREEVGKEVAAAGAAGLPLVVLEIPLLDADRGRQYGVNLVVLVEAPAEEAVRRAVARGLPEEDVRSRMAAQPTDLERRTLADRTLTNGGGMEELGGEVTALWEWLQENLEPN